MKRNHTGHRVGECHQRAKLSDGQVRNMRNAHEHLGMSRREVAEMFSVSYWTARDILDYRTRASA
jgi:transposase